MSKALGPLLQTQCKGKAKLKIKALRKGDGVNAWRVLMREYSARSTADSSTLMGLIMKPERASGLDDLQEKLQVWDDWVLEYETKFQKSFSTIPS